jgi:alkyl hydroperoxide reductase subunit AhpF
LPVLTEKNRADLKSRFDRDLKGPVTLRHFTQRVSQIVLPGTSAAPQSAQGTQLLRQAKEILEEMAAQAPDKVELEVYDFITDRPKLVEYRVDRIPCTLLDSGGRARFYGIPSGYEFTTIVQAVIDASRGSTSLREPTRSALAQLDKDVNIKVFVTPT